MIKSNFIVREYSGNQEISLSNVISIEAYNNSDVVVVINKYVIVPSKKVVVISPDFSVSDVKLELYFMPIPVIPTTSGNARPSNIDDYSEVPGVIPAKIAPELKQTVVLYVKSLLN